MNIKEIAKLANVSVATVSRVINNSNSVKESTKIKVLKVISDHNYKPDAIAKSLRKKSTGIYSIIFSVNTDKIFEADYSQELVQGALSYFSKHELKLIVDTHGNQKNLINYYKSIIDSKIVDGFIILDLRENDPRIDFLNSENFPYIVIGRNSKNNFNYIDSDNESGAFTAIEHLYQKNCKNILHIAGNKNNPVVDKRIEGSLKASKLHNINMDILYSDFSEEKAFEIYLKNKEKYDGMFFESDKMAIKILNEIKKPEIPMIGFDNIMLSKYFDLTTINQNIFEIGYNAAKNLHKLSQGQKINSIIIPTDLIERGSTNL
ncbi:LacI family transcriptional regulator [Oceanotoga sp. DSM 15011]|uniref:LacI family DNA-binding transcriptional regulator n=1 Tax=Oceanotoga sp. DSM 15011 TaxID=2984951 RepID=UPI0021F4DBC4|nr:LacI family DNA-binding transcriptional regulator [Oceanotoga sp. DSM 15011]UYO99299.1 LacI family transcriptional regulator [Oceanotoga sp. DSM 15011]